MEDHTSEFWFSDNSRKWCTKGEGAEGARPLRRPKAASVFSGIIRKPKFGVLFLAQEFLEVLQFGGCLEHGKAQPLGTVSAISKRLLICFQSTNLPQL